jgi:endonuclease YncB( thermonuclease family)
MRRLAALRAVLLVIAATGSAVLRSSTADAGPATFRATIAYAVDGDTLGIREPEGELAYVRLVGIDALEDVKPGYPTG